MRAWLLVVLVACTEHGSTPGDDDAPGDGPAGDLVCESGGTTFPALEKGCVSPDDCFIAIHQINCCGSLTAIGLNRSAGGAFSSAETACAAAYPGCGCAAQPTTAEDGRSEIEGSIQVGCDADRVCRTFVLAR